MITHLNTMRCVIANSISSNPHLFCVCVCACPPHFLFLCCEFSVDEFLQISDKIFILGNLCTPDAVRCMGRYAANSDRFFIFTTFHMNTQRNGHCSVFLLLVSSCAFDLDRRNQKQPVKHRSNLRMSQISGVGHGRN